MPGEFACITHDEVLRYEEILRVCALATKVGIRTVKVTGGEPLARKGCLEFIQALKKIPEIQHVTLTTNGVLLEPYIEPLAALRLDGLNISLDALEPAAYLRITGRNAFHQAWRSFHKAIEAGLRVKINCVPIRGLNEEQIIPLSRLAEAFPADVRFIELMPTELTAANEWTAANGGECLRGVPSAEILALLSREYPDLAPDASSHGFGPARYFQSNRLKGGIGLIDAISNHFCSGCNRLRLTSEGLLKPCLYHNHGLDVRRMLRNGASDSEMEAAIACAAYHKPERHSFGGKIGAEEGIRMMSRIGG